MYGMRGCAVCQRFVGRNGDQDLQRRMKPSPKKSPTKRMFSGMAGSPLASVVPVAVAVLEPLGMEPAPKKRGPMPKFGVAMTPAERKTRSRTNQKAKLDDAERRKLVAEILVIARRNLAGPDKPGRERITVKRRNDIRDENRNFLRILHDNLLRSSVDELQKSLEALSIPDSRGRLHNERSGETQRYGAKSEIEKILAGIQHDSTLFPETGDEDIDKQDPRLAGGFKVRPEGLGADKFEE